MWGCDRRSESTSFKMTCPKCRGRAGSSDECRLCSGEGVVGMRRCPRALVDRRAMKAVETVSLMEAFGGNWPNGKPLDEQENWLVQAVLLVKQEIPLIEKINSGEALPRGA